MSPPARARLVRAHVAAIHGVDRARYDAPETFGASPAEGQVERRSLRGRTAAEPAFRRVAP